MNRNQWFILFPPKVSAHCTCWTSDSAQRRQVYKCVSYRFFPLEMRLVRSCFSIAKSPEKRILMYAPAHLATENLPLVPPLPFITGWGGEGAAAPAVSTTAAAASSSFIVWSHIQLLITVRINAVQHESLENTDTFKTLLKTRLFKLAFGELEWLGWCTIGHCRCNWRMNWRNVLFASKIWLTGSYFPRKLD